VEVSESIGAADCRNGMGIAVGDYDRDGWFDYFYTNIHSPLLLHNNGSTFTDVTAAAGLDQDVVPGTGNKLVTWGTIFFDYDLDGFVDLCVASGTLGTSSATDPQPNLLYRSDGNGISFTDVSAGSGFDDPGRGRTVVMGDYDRDGDPDLFLVNYGEKAFLLRNDYANTTGHHWLILDLQGAGPGSKALPTPSPGRTTSPATSRSSSLVGAPQSPPLPPRRPATVASTGPSPRR
jgi:hypothetical protein